MVTLIQVKLHREEVDSIHMSVSVSELRNAVKGGIHMQGFKDLTTDMFMFGRWKVGEWRRVEGALNMDGDNFFYDALENCAYAYSTPNVRIFKCVAGDEVIPVDPETYPGLYVARELLLTEEVSKEEITAYFIANVEKVIAHKDYHTRALAARLKLGLDRLVKDPNPIVRAVVARQGYGLEKLVKDSSHRVRCQVAENGYALNKLINDPAPDVRAAVARQGYGLEELVNDPDPEVREIAKDNLKKFAETNENKYVEIFNEYCKDLTEDQKELARKCTENLRTKGPELYKCGLQSFVATLKNDSSDKGDTVTFKNTITQ